MQAGLPINFTPATSANRKIVNLETIETSGSALTIEGQSLNLNSALDATFTGPKLVINADVDIQGTLNSVSSTEVTFDDSTILLNSNKTGAAANGDPDAGFKVNRGDDPDSSLLWNETNDTWTLTGGKFVQLGNATFDNGTSTTIDVLSDSTGMSWLRLIGSDQGTGAVEVGQSSQYGGGMAYNGDNDPAFVTGETADHICFYRNDNGTRHEVFHYPYNSNIVNFNATPTVAGNPVWHQGNDGAGSTLDADLLDGMQPSKNNIGDTIAQRTTDGDLTARYHTMTHTASARNSDDVFFSSVDNHIRKNTQAGFRTSLDVYSKAEVDSAVGGASMSATAIRDSLKTVDGAGSGLDADTVDGLQATQFLRSDADDIAVGHITFSNGKGISTDTIIGKNTQITISAGEAAGKFSGQTGELVYVNAEGGLAVTTPDRSHRNFEAGYTADETVIRGEAITIKGNNVWHQGNLPVTIAKDGSDTVYTFGALP